MSKAETGNREDAAYAELHCLSNFSFLRGASHPEELVARAAELGYRALAISDRNSLAGVVRAHQAAKEHNLHLIIGAEITPADAPPIVLLAPDRPAYGQLARLITRGRLRTVKGECEIRLADIAELAEGLIGIVMPERYGGEGSRDRGNKGSREQGIEGSGEGFRKLSLRLGSSLDPWIPRSLDPFSAYRSIFGSRLYLAAELRYDVPDAARLAWLAELSEQSGIPLVACNDVHCHVRERRYLQDVLTCIREKCTLAEAGRRLFTNAERHLRGLEEIARRYTSQPDAALARLGRAAVARTVEIAERCRFTLDELRYEYPHELVPAGMPAMEHLERLTWEGAAQRYRDRGIEGSRDREKKPTSVTTCESPPSISRSLDPSIPLSTRQLIEAELQLIAELHYEHYFLTVHDLVRFARSRGILCQGRGSAANSAVCYCLGITAVDPARVDLLFERFISRERNEPPDIDVDFEHERREEVFQYIYKKYGRERAAIAAEVITYRPRSAVRDVGKALGLSLDRIDVLAKSLDWWDDQPLPEDALRNAGVDPRDRTIQMLLRLVKQILGFPRHLSQHVGGFVITETPLCEIVPLENGAMPDRTFIEWDKNDIDALGILKVDCLALGMLTAIRRCFELLRECYGKGLRDLGIEGLREGETHAGKADVSGSEGLAEVDRVGQACLRDDKTDAGIGTVRSDKSDAPRRSIDPQQHRGGQRSSNPQELHSLSDHGSRLAGGTRDTVDHRPRTEVSSSNIGTNGIHQRGLAHVAGTDYELATIGKGLREAGIEGLRDSGIQGLRGAAQTVPQSLNPLIPQSLLEIPPEDPAVYDMICRADTVGVFQIESRAQMSMLPRLKPRNYYDLVVEVAIVRPGPIQGGMVHPYLRRRHGLEPVEYPSEAVRKVLAKTLGVPIFQEQVMRLAVVAAGFTPGEADQLRRAMGAWRRSGSLEKFQIKLMKGMLERGYARPFAERIFKQIRGFGEYGFPESHAASFALLVYASAWLKRYHPAAFTAALLNAQPMGFYAPAQLVRDALEHGVPVFPVDVNFSGWDCALETKGTRERGIKGSREEPNLSDNQRKPSLDPSIPRSLDPCAWGRSGLALRLGMRLVRGLSEAKVRGVVAARNNGPIRSISELARRPDVSRQTLLRLAAADAFRSLGLNRRAALWHIFALDDDEAPLFHGWKGGEREWEGEAPAEPFGHRETGSGDRGIEGSRSGTREKIKNQKPQSKNLARVRLSDPAVDGRESTQLPPMTLDEIVVQDYDALGLSLNAHPIGLVRKELDALGSSQGGTEAGRHGGERRRLAGAKGVTDIREGEGSRDQGVKGSRRISDLKSRISNLGSQISNPIPEIPRLKVSPNETLKTARHGRRLAVAGLVLVRQRPGTASGVVFITLEDETGIANLIIRPRVWERNAAIARGKPALIAAGVVERQGEVVHLMVNRLYDLSAVIADIKPQSRDFKINPVFIKDQRFAGPVFGGCGHETQPTGASSNEPAESPAVAEIVAKVKQKSRNFH